MLRKEPDIMTIDEVCQYLRVAKSSLYRLAQDGRIPCQKVGKHWRFRKDAIDRWLEERKGLMHSEKMARR